MGQEMHIHMAGQMETHLPQHQKRPTQVSADYPLEATTTDSPQEVVLQGQRLEQGSGAVPEKLWYEIGKNFPFLAQCFEDDSKGSGVRQPQG